MTECGAVLLTHSSGKREQTRVGVIWIIHRALSVRSLPHELPPFLTEGIRKLFSGASMAASRGAMVTVGQVMKTVWWSVMWPLNEQDSLSSSLVFCGSSSSPVMTRPSSCFWELVWWLITFSLTFLPASLRWVANRNTLKTNLYFFKGYIFVILFFPKVHL